MYKLLANISLSSDQVKNIVEPITTLLKNTIPALLALVGAVGAIWCIVLAVRYAKAEDPQTHEQAKKALINAIIGFALVFLLLIALRIAVKEFTQYYVDYVEANP